jgi:hypothetical protein
MLDAKLVIIGGANLAQEFPLTLPATIGRSTENDIPLAHPLVSRSHCELFETDGRLFVRDLGSLNGTYVGNQPVEEVAPLEPGQLLTIGTVTLRAIYDGFDIDVPDDADVIADADFVPGGSPVAGSDRTGQTMIRPAAQTAKGQPGQAAVTETNAGLDTETVAPPWVETQPLPQIGAVPRRKRRSR